MEFKKVETSKHMNDDSKYQVNAPSPGQWSLVFVVSLAPLPMIQAGLLAMRWSRKRKGAPA